MRRFGSLKKKKGKVFTMIIFVNFIIIDIIIIIIIIVDVITIFIVITYGQCNGHDCPIWRVSKNVLLI